jgi:hypothetical protein
MATIVQLAFRELASNLEPRAYSREDAAARRDHLVGLLRKQFDVLKAFESGSLIRYTAVRDYADLDIMAVLHYSKHIKGKTPTQVLNEVAAPLRDYGPRVRRNGQAITLHYKTWPNVDLVPVYYNGDSVDKPDHYGVPDSTRGIWLKSRPVNHSNRMSKRNGDDECGPLFKRLVKMAKWWNLKHGAYLQSFHIEVITLNTFSSHLSESDYPWHAYRWFKKAAELVAAGSLRYDVSYADGYLDATNRKEAVTRLRRAESQASQAWHLTDGTNNDHRSAIAKWRSVFPERFPAYG